MFLKNITSVKHLFDCLESFENLSGLKANIDKTKFYSIGPSDIQTSEQTRIKINIKLLGLTITNDEYINIEDNFKPRVSAIKNILKHWSRRKLSLKGKITIINSLAISKIVYLATNLEVPNEILETLNKTFYEFLWDGKRPQIAAKTIENTIAQGGLKMPNIVLKVKSWQLSWLRCAISEPEAKWIQTLNRIINRIDFVYLAQCRTNSVYRAIINAGSGRLRQSRCRIYVT